MRGVASAADAEGRAKMTLMLELSPETKARLRRRAERAGQHLPDYLLAVAEAGEDEASASESSA